MWEGGKRRGGDVRCRGRMKNLSNKIGSDNFSDRSHIPLSRPHEKEYIN